MFLTMRTKVNPPSSQAGVSLIEVLVAILIVSFGVLGLVGLQARATQFSLGAEDRNRAALLANEIASQILSTRNVVLSAAELQAWNNRVSSDTNASGVADPLALPNGTVAVAASGAIEARITIEWQATSASGPRSSYVTDVLVLP
jgi:type IV pilus assembly protein PilV